MNDASGIPLNCGDFLGDNAPTYEFKKRAINGDIFYLNATPLTRTISPSFSGTTTSNDCVFDVVSEASTITDYIINISYATPDYVVPIVYSSNSGVLTVSDSYASGISSGSANIIATNDNYASATNVNVTLSTGSSSTVFSGYANDSLAKHVSDNIDDRINGLTGSASPIYTTQNHNTPIYVRNSGCWASDIDLTSISPWNSTNQQFMAGTLISPRHIIFAAHYQLSTGSTIRFVDNNNNIVTRTMTDKRTHPSYSPYYPDISIGVLDSDVPNSISFAKILPQNWTSYLPSLSPSKRLPCLVLDASETALISELGSLNTMATFYAPTLTNRLIFFENIVVGDSGNPAFLIVNGELVIITVWTYGGSGAGTSIVYHKDAINTMMSQLGGGYSLTEIDLSSFASY